MSQKSDTRRGDQCELRNS